MNPRYPLRYVRFRGGSFQPLTHLSVFNDVSNFNRAKLAGAFGPSLRSGSRLRAPTSAHARKSAQFQPLTHLSVLLQLSVADSQLTTNDERPALTDSLRAWLERTLAASRRSVPPERLCEPSFYGSSCGDLQQLALNKPHPLFRHPRRKPSG